MNKTNIEYLDYTWNPVAMRCTPVSEGCTNCWHIKMCDRLANNPKIDKYERRSYQGIEINLKLKELEAPLKRKKPAVIGVQFMGDLFHEDVGLHEIFQVCKVMREAKQHTFLLLTKRPGRMLELFGSGTPLPNVWLGVTTENQQRADERIPILLQIPAAKHFISVEPMLGPIDELYEYFQWKQLDGVFAGCETGPGRRSAKIQWFRDLKNQCVDNGIPFFLKRMFCVTGPANDRKIGIVKMPELDGKIYDQMPMRE